MRPSQNGSQPDVGFEYAQPKLGKPLQDAREDEMPHGIHVVTGKSQGVV